MLLWLPVGDAVRLDGVEQPPHLRNDALRSRLRHESMPLQRESRVLVDPEESGFRGLLSASVHVTVRVWLQNAMPMTVYPGRGLGVRLQAPGCWQVRATQCVHARKTSHNHVVACCAQQVLATGWGALRMSTLIQTLPQDDLPRLVSRGRTKHDYSGSPERRCSPGLRPRPGCAP